MRLLSVDSTSLGRVGYDPARRVLMVVFRDRSTYCYFDVPVAVFESLQDAPSKGAYFNGAIRGSYDFLPARCED
jgi:lysyl-tRNA synthetase, class II